MGGRAIRALPEQTAVEITWTTTAAVSARLDVRASIFPYDPNHQTFLNVYESARWSGRKSLARDGHRRSIYTGTRQGLWAVFTAFTASGVHHIAIGPDHILFIVGLLLLGGSRPPTAGDRHGVHARPQRDARAGDAADRRSALAHHRTGDRAEHRLRRRRQPAGRDTRAGTSGHGWRSFFGLVHGFGFASVLRETGLPPRALGLSLFSFNLGVEIGQAAIVVTVASALRALRSHNALLAARVATAGSVCVLLAGAFWFVERVW